ncbi:unnamed protein product [Symbiodinium microadriaticum]|nr:unnamed protein product [Symbiodinium microadriaticum]
MRMRWHPRRTWLWVLSSTASLAGDDVCNGILAGTECCDSSDEEATGEAFQRNMQKFGQVMGEGAHRYESCLNPSVCELDFTQLAELKASLMPLRDRSARTDVAETMSRTQAFETCAKHHARYVEIVVQLQQTKSCNFNHSGAFCAPVSCAVPYEKLGSEVPSCPVFTKSLSSLVWGVGGGGL